MSDLVGGIIIGGVIVFVALGMLSCNTGSYIPPPQNNPQEKYYY